MTKETTETLTLRLERTTIDGIRVYSSPGSGVTLMLHRIAPPDELQVTIADVPTRQERLAEVLHEFGLRVSLKEPAPGALESAIKLIEELYAKP